MTSLFLRKLLLGISLPVLIWGLAVSILSPIMVTANYGELSYGECLYNSDCATPLDGDQDNDSLIPGLPRTGAYALFAIAPIAILVAIFIYFQTQKPEESELQE